MSRYFNPYTDFGFKKLFAEEANKDLLIDFLNTLLPAKHQIATLTFRNPDVLGVAASERRAVFDVYCENDKHEPFIIEMQKAEQAYFIDRSVYYATQPIREQSVRGSEWNFEQKPVYFIGILNFLYDKLADDSELVCKVQLKDQNGKVFYDKLTFFYIQMPLFDKTESQLETQLDKWLYFLKNLPSLDHIPAILKEKVFQKAFHTAELASMDKRERANYEQDLNDYRTLMSSMETAAKNGIEQGIGIGTEQTTSKFVRNMKAEGYDNAAIIRITDLSEDEIRQID